MGNFFDWHAARTDLSNIALLDRAPESEGINLKAVRLYRLARVRSQMAKYCIDAVVLSDPINIRTLNTFEYTGCSHLAEGYETIDEIRTATTASFAAAGPNIEDRERSWAANMADLIKSLVGKDATVGLERLNANVALALRDCGLKIVDAQKPVEMARAVKSAEEMKCVIASLRATEVAVGELRDAIRPGMTENALWSVLHQSVIRQNGDYCETRLLSAGPRTNPWFQETSSYEIGPNELIALDTDVVGCHGYYSDFSRTFHSGPDPPTQAQRELYKVAYEQVHYNMKILRAGLTFREYAERAWEIPKKYYANRYFLSAHGTGMTGEYPYLYHRGDFPDSGYDGVLEAGMVICVESYIGEEGGQEGVKLEEQVLITEDGIEVLSKFPFEAALLQ
ncbi:hypothetical protein AYO22_02586 [Fonsecaea multimorphosa]|nr:hypothetical protein AYO22_02586 [Fonsecaea multimorphosa]